MKCRFLQVCVVVSTLIFAGRTDAADVIGYHASWSENSLLMRDNITTGTSEPVGPMGFGYPRELALSPLDASLYAIDDRMNLHRVNTTTGVASLVRAESISDFPAYGISITFAPDGTLYGSNGRSLYTIAPIDGSSSLVGSFAQYNTTRAIAVNRDGIGIGYDSGASWLFQFNASDASTTSIGYLPGNTLDALAFGADGTLYGWWYTDLFEIDLTSRTAEWVHTFGLPGGEAFTMAIPEPGTTALAVAGLIGLCFAQMRNRRKQRRLTLDNSTIAT